jgi:hypothetical protein
MLSVEEYRSKLYELAVTPLSRKSSQKYLATPDTNMLAATTSSGVAAKREKVKPRQTNSVEEKTNKPAVKTKNTLAPPTECAGKNLMC